MIDGTINFLKRLLVFAVGAVLVVAFVVILGAVAVIGAAVSLVGGLLALTGFGFFLLFMLMMYLIHGEVHEKGRELWDRVFD